MQAALDAGFVVVAPDRAVDFDGQPRLGWWRIEPASGAAADELETVAARQTTMSS
jgi:hypothetical protein